MIRLTIDGIEVEANTGETVLEAAKNATIYIPALCYDPDQPASLNNAYVSWRGKPIIFE